MKIYVCLINFMLISSIALSQYTVSGVISYYNSFNTPLNNVLVILHGSPTTDSTYTNFSGNYSFSNVINGNYSIEVKTTAPWGGGNASDLLKMKLYAAGILPWPESFIISAADINISGTINSTDFLKFSRILVGIDINTLGWIFKNNSFTGWSFSINNSNVILNISALCRGDVNGSYIP